MKLSPLHDRVVVKPIEKDEMSPGGIYIPPNAQEQPTEAVVEFVGPGKTLDNGILHPMTVKKGDTVIYGKYSGVEIDRLGIKRVVLRESDIVAIIL